MREWETGEKYRYLKMSFRAEGDVGRLHYLVLIVVVVVVADVESAK